MSIFSTDIIEEPWIGMAYKLGNCTNPLWQDPFWNDAFTLNFSKKKLLNKFRELMIRDNGTTKLTKDDFAFINETTKTHHLKDIGKEYKFIILMCLVVPTLDKLCGILNSCLVDSRKENGNVDVVIKPGDKGDDYLYIIIKVNTVTPQRIEILLVKK